jgi:hypothetical protein
MAFHINIQDVYELGAVVSFWGALDPTDEPVTLPSQNPFQIWHASNLIYQPDKSGGEIVFPPSKVDKWKWNQEDGLSNRVPPGLYTLKFFLKELREPISKDFTISTAVKGVLKSSAKWARRACLAGGPFVTLGEPITGTIVTVLAVPFELIENDPPSRFYEELGRVLIKLGPMSASV